MTEKNTKQIINDNLDKNIRIKIDMIIFEDERCNNNIDINNLCVIGFENLLVITVNQKTWECSQQQDNNHHHLQNQCRKPRQQHRPRSFHNQHCGQEVLQQQLY